MKKVLLLLLLILTSFSFYLSKNVVNDVVAASYDSYYTSADSSSGEKLIASLTEIITANHNAVGYGGLKNAYKTTDVKPGTNYIWDMYSNYNYVAGSSFAGSYSKEGDGYNREHSVPQSWFNEAEPMKSDLFHVYPTDAKVNGIRSNYMYGETNSPNTVTGNGSKLGSSSHKLYSGTVFEPIDEYKGDFARTYFYMATRYKDKVGSWGNHFKGGYPYLTNYSVDLFMKWHLQDPVSQKEISRNDAVYQLQKNRNPYIDHPEYANIIWGNGQTDTPTNKYSVTYFVDSDVLFNYSDDTQYTSGSLISEPNVIPTLEGYTFVGWYKDSSLSTKWDFVNDKITSNIKLYAKFLANGNNSSFVEVFKNLNIKSQLLFNVKETEGLTPVDKTIIIDTFTAGGGAMNDKNHNLAEYMQFDTSLFDITYNHNGSKHSYINSSLQELRLYNASGNGSSIDFVAKEGVKITDVGCDASGLTITVSPDGKSAKIHNTNASSSGNVKVKSISITYSDSSNGYMYELENDNLYINYVLELTEDEFNLYEQSALTIQMIVNSDFTTYVVSKIGDTYRLSYKIKVTDKTKVYTPMFLYNGEVIYINGFSAKSLAEYYLSYISSDKEVIKYMACLAELVE